jgi:hypothetical protein
VLRDYLYQFSALMLPCIRANRGDPITCNTRPPRVDLRIMTIVGGDEVGKDAYRAVRFTRGDLRTVTSVPTCTRHTSQSTYSQFVPQSAGGADSVVAALAVIFLLPSFAALDCDTTLMGDQTDSICVLCFAVPASRLIPGQRRCSWPFETWWPFDFFMGHLSKSCSGWRPPN